MKTEITSFEKACEVMGYDPIKILPDVERLPEWLARYLTAQTMRLVIADAIRGGKTVEPGQRAWFPVFRKASFGFSYSRTYYGSTLTYSGARLEFFTEEQSDFFGMNFTDLHRAVMTVENPKG